ncbi:hypothetical protein ABPG77_006816 [Micractinium sp. CCAP 211/92]
MRFMFNHSFCRTPYGDRQPTEPVQWMLRTAPPVATSGSATTRCKGVWTRRRVARAAALLGIATTASAASGGGMVPAGSTTLEKHGQSPFAACARPDIAALIRDKYADLGGWPSRDKLPVVYNERYNIGFFGLERLHPFDSKKFQRVLALLEQAGVLHRGQLVTAAEAGHDALREVHTEQYLRQLNGSPLKVAQVTELAPLMLLPPPLLRYKVLRPMATMAGGSMLGAALAMERGWAINLGGGMHHASYNDGGGWCPYSDITLALRRLRATSGGALRRVLVVDLDVHQGNGMERDKLAAGDQDLYILDAYNRRAYPWDAEAKQAIDQRVELEPGTRDEEYLAGVAGALGRAFADFSPELLIYNAGTDILDGDPLGRLCVSEAGVVERDRLVWAAAAQHRVPILMLLSGGYTRASTPVIAHSIQALFEHFELADEPMASNARS